MPPYEVLTKADVLRIHRDIIRSSGGETEGVLLPGNLALAVDAPNRMLFGMEPYPTLYEKAAVLLHELTKLHPFVAGNKRTAYASADTLLRMNGWKVSAALAEAIDVSLQTAQCSLDVSRLAAWIATHAVQA